MNSKGREPLRAEGEVTVTFNGVPIEGCKITELRHEREPIPHDPIILRAEGSFDMAMTQSAADRLRHWIDAATIPRYWLRRAAYVRGRNNRRALSFRRWVISMHRSGRITWDTAPPEWCR